MAAGGDKHSEQLPVTTGSIITESKGTFLGLEGMGALYVMGVFALITAVTNNFPLAVVCAVILYMVLRHLLNNKPDGFLEDILYYGIRPKIFEHRPREKRILIKKN